MSELVMRLSPSPVCSSPAFIAIPSYTCLIPPMLSCVAGSEHMDHGTLPSATLRPRIVCSDRYERHAAAQHTRCAHTAACTLALCPFPHDCSIVACVIVHRSAQDLPPPSPPLSLPLSPPPPPPPSTVALCGAEQSVYGPLYGHP